MRKAPKRLAGVALAAALGTAVSATAAGAGQVSDGAPAAAPEPGIWQKHQYSFAYMGFTSTYSCDGLADKLRILLLAAGARADAKAFGSACSPGYGRPDRLARADLTFYTLSPAAGSAPTPEAPPIPGHWAAVDLTEHQPRELGTGDCELVEQFKTNVLPLFTTRAVESHTTCIPHQISGSVINLRFESFSAVKSPPAPKAARQPAGAATVLPAG